MEEIFNKKEVLFNAAMGSIIRLNHVLNQTYFYSKELKAYEWYKELRQFYKEIDCKIDKKTREKIDYLLKELHPLVVKCAGKIGITSHLYFRLDQLEKLMRFEADKLGLLNPDKKTIMDLMGQFD